jgi:threonine/homoserine/homoserine lactone efflux protein
MLSFLSQGIGIGFAAGAQPGPFLNHVIGTALTGGWRRGIVTIFAPLVADLPLIVLSVTILRSVSPDFLRIVQLAGGLYLLWMAYGGIQRFRQGDGFEIKPVSVNRSFWQAVLMIYLGPAPYVFWVTISGPLLVQGLEQSLWHGLAFVLGFYGTFLAMLAGYVILFARLGQINPRLTRAIFLLTLAVMLVFGIGLIVQAFRGGA